MPDAITGGHAEHGEPTLFIAPPRIVEVCRFLKAEQQFVRLSSITAVDWIPADPRFEVVYTAALSGSERTAPPEMLGLGIGLRDRFGHRRVALGQLV